MATRAPTSSPRPRSRAADADPHGPRAPHAGGPAPRPRGAAGRDRPRRRSPRISYIDRWFVDCPRRDRVRPPGARPQAGRTASGPTSSAGRRSSAFPTGRSPGPRAWTRRMVRSAAASSRHPPAHPDDRHAGGRVAARTNYLYLTYRADADDVAPDAPGLDPGPRRRPVPDRLERGVRLVDDEPRRGAQGRRGPGGRRSSTRTRRRSRPITTAPTASISRRSPSNGSGTSSEFEHVPRDRHVRRQPARPEPDAAARDVRHPDPRDRLRSRSTRPRTARGSRALLERLHIPQPAWRAFTTDRGGGGVRGRGRLPGPRPPLLRPQRPGDAGHLRVATTSTVPHRSGPASPRSTRSSSRSSSRGRTRWSSTPISDGERRPGRRDPRARRARRYPLRRRDLLPPAPAHRRRRSKAARSRRRRRALRPARSRSGGRSTSSSS